MSVQHFVFCSLIKLDELDSTAPILEMPKLLERRHDKSYFLYSFSIVGLIFVVAYERVGYGCALLVALGNAVRWSSDHLGSYVLSQ